MFETFTIPINDLIEDIGMIGFAIAGLMATEKSRVDPIGVFVAIFSTAFGGGIIRDLMLDLRPFYWMSHPHWLWLTFLLTVFAPHLIRKLRMGWRHRLFIWADAIGLAFFAVGSTATAWTHDQGAFVSVLIGVATSVFGGLLRDVFFNRLPSVLSNKRPYAAAAFVGSWCYLAMINILGIDYTISLWCSCALVVAIRMASFKISTLRITYNHPSRRNKTPC